MILDALLLSAIIVTVVYIVLDLTVPDNWGKNTDNDIKPLLYGVDPSQYPFDVVTLAFGKLGKELIDQKIVTGNKWHTVEFYVKKDGKGLLLDEIRVSNIKR